MGYTLLCTRRKIMSKISNYILYYPSIEFQSTEWVKSSLLLWDAVYRIVPEGYEPIDNDEIRAFVDAGLIRNIVPTDDEKKSIEKKFKRTCKQLESPQYRPAGLQSSDYDLILIPYYNIYCVRSYLHACIVPRRDGHQFFLYGIAHVE